MSVEQLRVDQGVSRLARELNISPSVVSKKRLAGKSDQVIRQEAELYRAMLAEREVEDDTGSETYQAARSRKESSIANLRGLEFAEKEGKLIDRAQTEADAFKTARTVRNGLIAIPDRVASLLAAESDPARVHAVLSAEIREVLAGLAGLLVEVPNDSE